MSSGRLVDVSQLKKIIFYLMKKSGQNIAPSMIDAFLVVVGLLFVPI